MRFPKLLFASFALAGILSAADTGIWKVAPPPPASWQNGRLADLAARRKAVMDRIGSHAILILYAAEPRNYANDVDWPFRQENNFFYLTGLTQPGATLVLAPGAAKLREMVFIPRPVPSQETWTGHMITAAEATATSGIADVFEAPQTQHASRHPGAARRRRAQRGRERGTRWARRTRWTRGGAAPRRPPPDPHGPPNSPRSSPTPAARNSRST